MPENDLIPIPQNPDFGDIRDVVLFSISGYRRGGGKSPSGSKEKARRKITLNNLLPIVIQGLTYQGNLPHSLLNYSLIVLTLAPFVVSGRRSRIFTPRRWFGCLLIAIGVQILLWLSVRAVGVSVVWCTMAGYGLMEYAHDHATQEPVRRRLFTLAFVSALVAIGYYAVTFPPLTTLAHGLAVAMGMGIFYLLRFLRIKRDAKQDIPHLYKQAD